MFYKSYPVILDRDYSEGDKVEVWVSEWHNEANIQPYTSRDERRRAQQIQMLEAAIKDLESNE